MGNLFNIDGKVYRFLETLANIMGVSLLWVLYSIPIFTIGASTTALYLTVHKVIRHNEGRVWQLFWGTFKSNFKQATVLWLFLLLVCAFFAVDGYICYILSDVIPVLKWILVLVVVLLVFCVMWSLYWFPYISHIQDSNKAVLKNTLIMCVLHLLSSLSLLVAFGLCIWVIFTFSFYPAFLAFLPAGYMYFASIVLEKIFGNYWDVTAEYSDDESD